MYNLILACNNCITRILPASRQMIFEYNGEKRIFIHVPKTGGNTIQAAFISHGLTMDQKIRAISNQDGIDRFDIRGPSTKRKHQSLSSYIKHRPTLQRLRILTAVRAPFERLVSFYFAPFNHAFVEPETRKIILPETVVFNESEFIDLTKKVKTAAEILSISRDYIQMPKKLDAIKTESLDSQFRLLFPTITLKQRLNVSPYQEEATKVRQSKELKKEVLHSKHAIDYQLFYPEELGK